MRVSASLNAEIHIFPNPERNETILLSSYKFDMFGCAALNAQYITDAAIQQLFNSTSTDRSLRSKTSIHASRHERIAKYGNQRRQHGLDIFQLDWLISSIEKSLVEADLLGTSRAVEGLYRISASIKDIDSWRYRYVRTEDGEGEIRSSVSIHVLAGVLKRTLRNSKEPLLSSFALHQLYRLKSVHGQKLALKRSVDVDKYGLVKKFFNHLHFVASRESITKMTPNALATVWAPNIFDMALTEDILKTQIDVTATLIEQYSPIFEKEGS